mgnify:CR=1 FL=1
MQAQPQPQQVIQLGGAPPGAERLQALASAGEAAPAVTRVASAAAAAVQYAQAPVEVQTIELTAQQRNLLIKVQRYYALFGSEIDFLRKEREELITMTEQELYDHIKDLKTVAGNKDISGLNKVAVQIGLGAVEGTLTGFTNWRVQGLGNIASPYRNREVSDLVEEMSLDQTDFTSYMSPIQRLGLLISGIAYQLHATNTEIERQRLASLGAEPPPPIGVNAPDFVAATQPVDEKIAERYSQL